MDSFDAAMLVLRIGLGLVFIAHGIKHARGRLKTTNWFASMGFLAPGMQWAVSTATELAVGLLLLAGLLTSLAAAGVIGIMFVAFWTVHRPAGFWVTARPDEGWEYVFTLSVAAVALAIAGPGEASLDHALDISANLDGWVGAALVVGGLVTAALQLATFFRPER